MSPPHDARPSETDGPLPEHAAVALTPAMVLAIAELAHLELTADEVATLGTELTAILGFATIVQQVDTTSVPPTTHAFGVASPLRADTPEPSPPRDAMLANAPEPAPRSGHMKVPQVMG